MVPTYPRPSAFLTFVALLLFCLQAQALSFNRRACQSPTRNPLKGCPKGTLLVDPSSDGSSKNTFATIQSAILAVANATKPEVILVMPGTYSEQLNITTSAELTLLGITSGPTDNSKNVVSVTHSAATGNTAIPGNLGTTDNMYTATMVVAPTYEAGLTGSGPTGYAVPADTPFGTTRLSVYNIDLVNDFLPYSAGPALALSTGYANTGFYYSRFYSYQDTIFIGKLGNAYFYECDIAGQTDFLYGFGTMWVQSSKLLLRSCGGGITAWKGTNTTFVNKYGVYIHDSDVVKANSSLQIEHKCALGRPWNAQHRSIFARCYMDDSILPAGYILWGTTDPRYNYNTTMAEWRDYGPGFNRTARIEGNVTILMDDREYAPYSTLEKVFQYSFSGKFGNVGWIDRRPEA